MSTPEYIRIEAKRFVAMLRTYAHYKRYKAGWVVKVYETRYPTRPLSQEEFDNSGTARPTGEFKTWVRAYHAQGYKSRAFSPSPRFMANRLD